ncbi:MAG: hypothetical protein FWF86_00510 [Clostridia bacterium]|nr:hypothetical protein [Clostridia bacterium]
MERFLRYSFEHGRPIRGVLLVQGKLVQKTFTVLAMTRDEATLELGRKKPPLLLPRRDILSCDYARGDSGES